ncbi:MAG: hypothetical protein KDA41_00425, partial [Planctomycetales bacterium]|nr:hypothetical protein [Planctomycetales bacterium]
TSSRFGVDASFNLWSEELPAGGHDELWTGDCNLVFRFAQSPAVQMRSGLGLNWLADSTGEEVGVNFTYAVDLYPGDPWVISSELDLGSLGRTSLVHWRGVVGVQLRRSEFFAGYDYTSVGGVELSGLVAGVRTSF